MVATELFVLEDMNFVLVVDYFSRYFEIQRLQQQQHLFRISRLHTEFYNFLYKWILADLNLAN